jgi:hypothetical protein
MYQNEIKSSRFKNLESMMQDLKEKKQEDIDLNKLEWEL